MRNTDKIQSPPTDGIGIINKIKNKIISPFNKGSVEELSADIKKSSNNGVDNIITIESKEDYRKADSLDKVLRSCKVDENEWETKDFSVKELANGNFLWTVRFKKKLIPFNLEKAVVDLCKLSPKVELKKYPDKNKEDGVMVEILIADHHWGKLTTKEETGEDYNLKIATKIFKDAVDYNIRQILKHNVDKIIFVTGNDIIHTDNFTNNITTAGTPQDSDGKLYETFREVTKVLIESINKLQNIAPVDCVLVHGNHSRMGEFYLGEVLYAYYYNNPNVRVDNTNRSRKYYRYGNSLITYLHGDSIKLADLPIIMASENSKEWGTAKYRYAKLGHFHHQKMMVNEISGTIVEIVPTLCHSDKWHKDKGFGSNIRSSVTSIYSKTNGLINKIYYNL